MLCSAGGQASDLVGADQLLPGLAADALLADKAYDADDRVLAAAEVTAVIPPKCNRVVQREYDREWYQARHLIENFFQKLKQYRAIATRYDKLARNFLAGVLKWTPCLGQFALEFKLSCLSSSQRFGAAPSAAESSLPIASDQQLRTICCCCAAGVPSQPRQWCGAVWAKGE